MGLNDIRRFLQLGRLPNGRRVDARRRRIGSSVLPELREQMIWGGGLHRRRTVVVPTLAQLCVSVLATSAVEGLAGTTCGLV